MQILKETYPGSGAWIHSHYEDESGITTIGAYDTIEEYARLKADELLSNCKSAIYCKFTIWDKWFSCDIEARDDIRDLEYAYSNKPGFTGRYWFVHGGTELVFITPEMVPEFVDAMVEWKDLCWERYAYLSNQLKAIDLQSSTAKQEISAITWEGIPS